MEKRQIDFMNTMGAVLAAIAVLFLLAFNAHIGFMLAVGAAILAFTARRAARKAEKKARESLEAGW